MTIPPKVLRAHIFAPHVRIPYPYFHAAIYAIMGPHGTGGTNAAFLQEFVPALGKIGWKAQTDAEFPLIPYAINDYPNTQAKGFSILDYEGKFYLELSVIANTHDLASKLRDEAREGLDEVVDRYVQRCAIPDETRKASVYKPEIIEMIETSITH